MLSKLRTYGWRLVARYPPFASHEQSRLSTSPSHWTFFYALQSSSLGCPVILLPVISMHAGGDEKVRLETHVNNHIKPT